MENPEGTRTRSRETEQDFGQTSLLQYGSTTMGNCTTAPGPCSRKLADTATTIVVREKTGWMTDVITPHFHTLKNKGVIINNGMTSEEKEVWRQPTSITAIYDIARYGCTPNRWYPYARYANYEVKDLWTPMGSERFLEPSLDAGDLANLKDEAVSRAWANIGQGDLMAISSLAESKSSLVGLVYLMRKVSNVFFYYRTKRYKLLAKQFKPSELAELYMNMRYNLRPLYYDAKALYESITGFKKEPYRGTFRSKLTVPTEISSDLFEFGIDIRAYYQLYGQFARSCSYDATIRAGVLVDVKPSIAAIAGFDLIADSAWDLLPLSFIYDWFFNIGDVIASFTPNYGCKPLASWVTLKEMLIQSTTLVGTRVETSDVGGNHVTSCDASAENGFLQQIKSTYSRVPSPKRAMLPHFTVKLDPLKILDLVLIITNLKKFLRKYRW